MFLEVFIQEKPRGGGGESKGWRTEGERGAWGRGGGGRQERGQKEEEGRGSGEESAEVRGGEAQHGGGHRETGARNNKWLLTSFSLRCHEHKQLR